ncbi:hypothetical protein OQA88_8111 [Cercophora sp. LCS_1]
MPQVIYYHPGAGTEQVKIAQVLGGAFGYGVPQDIAETYRFICDNYRAGDELFIIGFSRGAFTARSVAGMVCAVGYLNRSGIEQLPHIFGDYSHWSSWKDVSQFNDKIHLRCFTLENLEKIEQITAVWENIKAKKQNPSSELTHIPRGRAELEEELRKDKLKLFQDIVGINNPNGSGELGLDARTQVADKYRTMLAKHQMLMTSKCQSERPGLRHGAPGLSAQSTESSGGGNDDASTTANSSDRDGGIEWQNYPIEGKVRAIGVWDTVGSLGIPKTPLSRSTRRAQEIQFESLYIHPKIDYAFHAIALDEWRTAFRPTMWGTKDNTNTKLRQVWFPGNHGNVGGGWQDQQVATIALAWMADQLTPLGVEFSRQEMERIFSSINPGIEVREWGMGRIHNPAGVTTYFDKAYNLMAIPYRKIKGLSTNHAPRTPGRYSDEERAHKPQPLVGTNEFIHPAARIRYLYSGLGLDDKGVWGCGALAGRGGYQLRYDPGPAEPRQGRQRDQSKSEYQCVVGVAIPYYGKPPNLDDRPKSIDRRLVRVEQPNWFKAAFNRTMEELIPVPAHRWYWAREDDSGELKILEEEHLGIWEQKFMHINDRLLKEQAELAKDKTKTKTKEGDGSCRYKLRDGITLPEGYSEEYRLHDIIRWENWEVA